MNPLNCAVNHVPSLIWFQWVHLSHISVFPYSLIPFLYPFIFSSPITKKYPPQSYIMSISTSHFHLLSSSLINFEIKFKSFPWTPDSDYRLVTRCIYLRVSGALPIQPVSTLSNLRFLYSFRTGKKYYLSLSYRVRVLIVNLTAFNLLSIPISQRGLSIVFLKCFWNLCI